MEDLGRLLQASLQDARQRRRAAGERKAIRQLLRHGCDRLPRPLPVTLEELQAMGLPLRLLYSDRQINPLDLLFCPTKTVSSILPKGFDGVVFPCGGKLLIARPEVGRRWPEDRYGRIYFRYRGRRMLVEPYELFCRLFGPDLG